MVACDCLGFIKIMVNHNNILVHGPHCRYSLVLLTIVTRVYSQKGFPEAYYADLDIPKSQYLA